MRIAAEDRRRARAALLCGSDAERHKAPRQFGGTGLCVGVGQALVASHDQFGVTVRGGVSNV